MNVLSLLPLNFHSSDDEAYDALARHLSALKEALCNLGAPIARESDRHQKLAPTVNPVPLVASGLPRRTLQTQSNTIHSSHGPLHHPVAEATPSEPLIFPYRTTFKSYGGDNGGEALSFTYKGRMHERSLLFRGKLNDGNKWICIKFVRRYGKEAHMWCARQGFAPKLIGFEAVHGGWYMVIMEHLDESWVGMADEKNYSEELKQKIHAAIIKLHQYGMVHGDVRDTNVMVRKDGRGEFMLIDYDWAGQVGKVKYPRHVNKAPELGRPDDVEDNKTILTEHDELMLQHMFRQYMTL